MRAREQTPDIAVSICAGALEAVFAECDRYEREETGGRILGTFRQKRNGALGITVSGVIGPGPNARRSSSSFFQDGKYQEQVFRHIERAHPDVEHLGNWHTHHVNGYPALSGGDIETYQRTVNHQNHNLNFFYALLVVARNPGASGLDRYRARHYVLFRDDDRVHEVDAERVSVTDEPVIWLADTEPARPKLLPDVSVRAQDKATLEHLYPGFRPYQSKRANMFYWRGVVRLIDDSVIQLTVPELMDGEKVPEPFYQVFVKNTPKACSAVATQLGEQHFHSAAEAVYSCEQQMNRTLYQAVLGMER